jgi:hypothetical protein
MGLFDSIFQDVSSTLLDLVSDTKDTITYTPAPTYDLVTATETAGTAVTAEVNSSPPFPFKQDEIDGTSIKQGDFRTIISAKDLTTIVPSPGLTTYTRGGTVYQIVRVDPISGGDEVAAWILHCRE